MKAGLLMEAAQSHQRLAESTLKKLKAHASELDDLLREEIRSTVTGEIRALAADSERAADALQRLQRAAGAHFALWSVSITAACMGIAAAVLWWVVPSQKEITALRASRDELVLAIDRLEREGGRMDLKRCGKEQRLCVRVDRAAPVYGKGADYLVVQGY